MEREIPIGALDLNLFNQWTICLSIHGGTKPILSLSPWIQNPITHNFETHTPQSPPQTVVNSLCCLTHCRGYLDLHLVYNIICMERPWRKPSHPYGSLHLHQKMHHAQICTSKTMQKASLYPFIRIKLASHVKVRLELQRLCRRLPHPYPLITSGTNLL